MRVLLVAPASGPWRLVGRKKVFNGKTFRFSLLSLLSVAAETPEEHEVRIVDEQVERTPWDADVDLVGITCMTALAPRAYEVAERFRVRGIPVVLGGMHPTFLPEEALQHADAVVVGEAEGIWQQVLREAASGKLQGVYRSENLPDLNGLRPPRRELLRSGKYARVHAVQATRGCPARCDFCSVTAFNHNCQRQRPVPEVVEEVASLPARSLLFVDDNLTAEKEYARALFEGLVPLRKRWVAQSSLSVARDSRMLDLAAQAGCRGLFIGLETFSDENLRNVKKHTHRVAEYREAVSLLHSRGIGVEAGIVLGFDGDDATVFRETLHLLDDLKIDLAQVSIATPLPGTPFFESMRDRVFDRNWAHYDFHHVVFEPKRMSAEALQAGHDWVTSQFYKPWRIARRIARRVAWPRGIETVPYALAMNLAYYGRVHRWGFCGWDPASESAGRTAWAGPFDKAAHAAS